MKKTDRRQQQIEHIAVDIAEHGVSASEAQAINDSDDGWTIDARYASHEYVSDSDYTRTTDVHLGADELRQALALADHIEEWAVLEESEDDSLHM